MLQYKYTEKSEIPEGLEQYYAEKDGEFVLKVEGMEDTSKLEKALNSERKIRREAEAKVKDLENKYSALPEDFDIEKYNDLMDKSGGDLDAKLKEQRERINEQHQKELKKYQDQLAEKEELVNTEIRDRRIKDALLKNNVHPDDFEVLEDYFARRAKVEGGEVYLDEKPVSEAIKEWASEKGQRYVAAPANSGGGTHDSNKSNGAGKREMSRSDFDALGQAERMAAVKQGIQLTD